MSQEEQWYLIDGSGYQCGPYTSEQLQNFANDGRIMPTTRLWTKGLKGWISASDVEWLFPAPPKDPQPVSTPSTNLAAPATLPSNDTSTRMKSYARLRMMLPVGCSGLAIAASWTALGSLLLCGIPAPVAVILGILALKDVKKNPEKDGKGRAWFAIICGTIQLLAIAAYVIRFLASSAEFV